MLAMVYRSDYNSQTELTNNSNSVVIVHVFN
jgi:hypothetical protein